MILTLQREPSGTNSTMGELFLNGTHECWTLELPQPIPAGKYRVTPYESPGLHRTTLLLHDVPEHTWIEIHNGNNATDTKNCILVGTSKAIDWVGNSVVALVNLVFKVQKAIKWGDEIWCEIRDCQATPS